MEQVLMGNVPGLITALAINNNGSKLAVSFGERAALYGLEDLGWLLFIHSVEVDANLFRSDIRSTPNFEEIPMQSGDCVNRNVHFVDDTTLVITLLNHTHDVAQ
jgi:hypothetical protein